MPRPDGRADDELRPITFERDYTEMSAGSVLVTFGKTRVLCTASIDEDVPRWMKNSGKGWVTAEYSMLPGATPERVNREAAKGKQSGRTQEIQRLIGRSLRAVTDLTVLGEFQITVDCDALQADGGTRTAAICGGYLALHDACERMVQQGMLRANPVGDLCAAISVGIVSALPSLDLDYVEDSSAEVDMNVVMTGEGRFIEVQGTAEGAAFSRTELDAMLAEANVVSAGVYSAADMYDDPHFRERGLIVDLEDPEIGTMPVPGITPKLSETPGGIRWGGKWEVGADNEEVWCGLVGLTQGELGRLQEAGIV